MASPRTDEEDLIGPETSPRFRRLPTLGAAITQILLCVAQIVLVFLLPSLYDKHQDRKLGSFSLLIYSHGAHIHGAFEPLTSFSAVFISGGLESVQCLEEPSGEGAARCCSFVPRAPMREDAALSCGEQHDAEKRPHHTRGLRSVSGGGTESSAPE